MGNGVRNVQKALLNALVTPFEQLKVLQNECNFTKLMVMQEELKTMDFGAVWEQYLFACGVQANYYDEIAAYEKNVLSKRI